MDPRHRQVLGPKDHLQLRQQVKAYLPFFWLLPFFTQRFIRLFMLFSHVK